MRIIILVIVAMLLSVLVSFTYRWENIMIKRDDTILWLSGPNQYIGFVIDDIKIDYKYNGKFIHINGAIIPFGESITRVNNEIYLIDEINHLSYRVNTVSVKRPSATEYYNDGNNYDNSGFSSYGDISKLNKQQYRVAMKYNDKYMLLSDKVFILE